MGGGDASGRGGARWRIWPWGRAPPPEESPPAPVVRVRKTGGNRSGSTGSRWNRSGPVHEPVRFPPLNRAYNFYLSVNRPV
jgi:hypothetical protein